RQLFADNQVFQLPVVVRLRTPRVLYQSNVLRKMQIAQSRPTLRRAKLDDVDVIPSSRILHRMYRLMHVTHEMHEKFQGFNSLLARETLMGENVLKNLNPVNHTIVMILLARPVPRIRMKAIPRFNKAAAVRGMSTKCQPAVSGRSNLISSAQFAIAARSSLP